MPLATFARGFPRQRDVADLVVHTEQAFEFALDEQVLDIGNSRRLLTAAGIVSLIGTTQPTVSSWIDRGLLVPETRSGAEPYQRGRGLHAYFPEPQLRNLI